MLRPPGFHSTELGDIEVFVHDGRIHLFHLCLPSHDRIAHWVSEDGIDWEPRRDALRTGDPGSFDDDQLWTMSVTRHEGRFVMLYTALSTADGGRVQRIARATSTDLERWTKDPEPVAVATAEHYETTPGRSAAWVTFRDPKPVATPDGYAVVVSAQVPSGPVARRGAVALLRSNDLSTFRLDPPVHVPRRAFELECPQLVATDEGFMMIASLQDDRSVRWFHADGLQGPYRTPARSRILPAPYYAARVFQDEHGLAIAGTYRYNDARGRLQHVMPTPMRIHRQGSGRVVLRPWQAADARFESDAEPLRFETPRFDNAQARHEGDTLAVDAGEELWVGSGRHEHALVRGRVRCDAPRFGLAFDVSLDGAAWCVELEPALGRARLIHRAPELDPDGMPWFEHRTAQTTSWVPARDTWDVQLRILGHEVELSIDDEVVLSAVVDRRNKGGNLGVWADSGQMWVQLGLHRPTKTDRPL